MPRPYTVIEAPSNLGLRPPAPGTEPGVRRFPEALRATGFVDRIGAVAGERLEAPPYAYDWDGKTVFNAAAIADYARRLADRVGEVLDDGRFPVVIGGDCSILLGPALALRRRGRYGLAHLDGHADFRHLGNSPAVGAAAGEDFALVTGRGQGILTDIDGLRPYVRDEDAITIGDTDEPEDSADLRQTAIASVHSLEVEERGIEAALAAAVARVDRPDLDGYWIHLDVDVLDSTLMPAVDSPHGGGLTWEQLGVLLGGLLASERATGLNVTIFDPGLDPDGRLVRELADFLVGDLYR